jgi:glycosyltransferase involved in cell wall biosynthesis
MNQLHVMLLADLKAATSVPQDLYRRYKLYGSVINEISKGKSPGLLLISGGHQGNSSGYFDEHLQHISHSAQRTQFRKAARNAFRELQRRDIEPTMIIAGDPFFGLLSAFLLRKKLSLKIPIQVSFHGEITESGFGTSIKSRLQNLFVQRSIPKVESVRLVSTDQINYAKKLFGVTDKQIVIAPVPLTSQLKKASRSKKDVVAFVGRIHPQRGIDTWVETMRNLSIKAEALIVGDGPLKSKFLEELSQVSKISVNATGYISQGELDKTWSKISVLLSTAPYESYGMAMREAVLHGVPVVSIRNSGAQKLHDECPKMITLVDNAQEAARAVEKVLKRPPSTLVVNKYKRDFLKAQERYLKALAKSWLGNLSA